MIAAEMIAGFLIAMCCGLVWLFENRDPLLHKLVMTLLWAVLLADALGIITLAYTGIDAAFGQFAPACGPPGRFDTFR